MLSLNGLEKSCSWLAVSFGLHSTEKTKCLIWVWLYICKNKRMQELPWNTCIIFCMYATTPWLFAMALMTLILWLNFGGNFAFFSLSAITELDLITVLQLINYCKNDVTLSWIVCTETKYASQIHLIVSPLQSWHFFMCPSRISKVKHHECP